MMTDDAELALEQKQQRARELDAQAGAMLAEIRRIHRNVVAQFELSDRVAKIERDVSVLKARLARRDSAATRG